MVAQAISHPGEATSGHERARPGARAGTTERPRFFSPDAALRFYLEVGPRLQSAKSRNVHSVEDFVAMTCSGGKRQLEELLALCADISVCLDVLTDEEARVVGACFGLVEGQVRRGAGYVSVADENEPSAGIVATVPAAKRDDSLHWSSVGRPAPEPKAKGKGRNGRPRERLSYSGAARALGWYRHTRVGPDNAPKEVLDHQRVSRVYAKARRKIAGRLRARGLVA